MTVVIKVGGRVLEDAGSLQRCARGIAGLASGGHRVVVVHGGGSELTAMLKRLGKESEFSNGLRVTDRETRDVALMVLAGRLNKLLVAAISKAGQPAMGLCGGDGAVFRAAKKKQTAVDLGFVGEICAANPRWIEAIWQAGGVPVIASIALGSDGEYYNVNADQMAAACAAACGANTLIFLTDVAGVTDAAGNVMRWLDMRQIPGLVRQQVVHGGMLPKLEACCQALRGGVSRVRILPAEHVEVLPEFYLTGTHLGTEVTVA